jgi:formate transporter
MPPQPSSFLIPSQMADVLQSSVQKKIAMPAKNIFFLAILAGIFIAFGGLYCTIVGTDVLKVVPYGVTRLLMGIVFCLGLILVILGGAELFTGNTMLVILDLKKRSNIHKLLANWSIVYVGNFIGSLFIAFLFVWGGCYLFGAGSVGKTALAIAITKTSYSFGQAFFLGILCNMLVCLAIWLTFSAQSTTGKIFAILFPVSAFVASGFEHSVANMYLIPVALFMKAMDPQFIFDTHLSVIHLTWITCFLNNLLPVTLGNIVGGMLIWLPYHFIFSDQKIECHPAFDAESKNNFGFPTSRE